MSEPILVHFGDTTGLLVPKFTAACGVTWSGRGPKARSKDPRCPACVAALQRQGKKVPK